MKNYLRVIVILLVGVFFLFNFGCYKAPAEISYGIDECAECGMIISDQRFGSEIVLRSGLFLKYDTIDCLVKAILDNDIKSRQIKSRWVVDYSKPGKLIYLPNALFYRSNKVNSPSGLNIIAVEEQEVLEKIFTKHGGQIMSFKEVVDYVKQSQLSASL